MVFKSEFYGGSRLFTPVAEVIGLPIDQVNFLMCQLFGLCFAVPFRTFFSVDKVGVGTRHFIEAAVGVFLTVFCFGYQISHLLVQSLVSYAFMAYGGRKWSHSLVFVFAMLYLSVCHIYRQVYDYGGYTLDITGPLMIQSQRLTSLAFALHDGRYKKEENLSKDQAVQSVKRLPNILEFLSYMMAFHGVMVGPFTYFNDHMAFIDGTSLTKEGGTSSTGKKPLDNLNKVVIKKLFVAAAMCAGMMILPPLFFPPDKLNTPYFYSMSFIEKMIFIVGVVTFARFKYYFAWVLADAVNNLAGFGFSGYDSKGEPVWDLADSVDIWDVEMSTSLKTNLGGWNKKTNEWLRAVIYFRAPMFNTFAVFLTSAFWHGFYPGYYITFISGAAMTIVARQVRRNVRPYFQTSETMKMIYDAITFTATRFANAYDVFPFLILEFYACVTMYMSVYFCLHAATLVLFLFFTFFPLAKQGGGDRGSRHSRGASSTTMPTEGGSTESKNNSSSKPTIEDSGATTQSSVETAALKHSSTVEDEASTKGSKQE